MRIEAVVFDLGGVLVRLGGMDEFMSLVAPELSKQAFHRQWLHSDAVRAHESGKITVDVFLDAYQRETVSNLPRQVMRDLFDRFITGPYEGAAELLRELKSRIPVAILSNVSKAHWTGFVHKHPDMVQGVQLFLSYEMSLLKPDPTCFQHVIDALGYSPEKILFFDDNLINVEAAKKAGFCAYRVNGIADASLLIESHGV